MHRAVQNADMGIFVMTLPCTDHLKEDLILACGFRHVEEHLELISALLRPQVSSLSGTVQNVFIHNALKVYCTGLCQVAFFDL